VVAVIGAVALAGTLAACSGGQPGAAAVVGDRVVRTADVDTAMSELSGLLPNVAPSAVLTVLMIEPIMAEHSSEAGLGVTDQQAEDFLAEQAASQEVTIDSDLSAPSITVGRYLMEITALQQTADGATVQQAISDEYAAQDISVNPRFGTVDANGAIGATAYPWIVQTQDTATAQ
jgi:hypothetical protein